MAKLALPPHVLSKVMSAANNHSVVLTSGSTVSITTTLAIGNNSILTKPVYVQLPNYTRLMRKHAQRNIERDLGLLVNQEVLEHLRSRQAVVEALCSD